jgi:hypothetical protein
MNKQQLAATRDAFDFLINQHSQLRLSQLALLLRIAEKEGQTQTELANESGLSTSAISRAVDVLGLDGRRDKTSTARMGWIEARGDINDDRTKQVFLTAKGRHLVQLLLDTLQTGV